MSAPLAHLTRALRTVLTTEADRAAERVGFVRRRRKLSGAAFVQALVFGWIDDPHAPVDALTARFPTPGVTLTTGMDGTNKVFISGATDLNGYSLALTNPLTVIVDATFPVLSAIGASPAVQSALITWTTD